MCKGDFHYGLLFYQVSAASEPQEDKSNGSLSAKTYLGFFRAGGSIVVLLLMIFSLLIGEVQYYIPILYNNYIMTVLCFISMSIVW